MTIEFRILGPLEVRRDGTPLPLGGPRQRALLALLLTRPNAAVPRSRLIDELWPEEPPATAVNVLQTYVSHLRRVLPPGRLVTRPPGYAILVEDRELDLRRFEQLVADGRDALAAGNARQAAETLRAALGLWRGPALGDVTHAAFAEVEAARLEELRLAAREQQVEAELALGREAELVGELEALVAEHPLRERLRAQLMLALYRAGRQSDALAAYREARSRLADELGIAPGPALRELESAILRQDPALGAPAVEAPAARAGGRSLLGVAVAGASLDAIADLAEPLARRPGHELVLVGLVPEPAGLADAARRANEARAALAARGLAVRAAASTSADTSADVLRLARDTNAALMLLERPVPIGPDGRLEPAFGAVLAEAVCDVCVVVAGARRAADPDAPVVVPFGGAEHEWAAAEIGAWLAASEDRRLLLVGVEAASGRRDASRLLARVALLVQQVAGVQTEPALVRPGAAGVLDAAAAARAILVGLPDDWRTAGLGTTRSELLERASAPLLLVRSGLRPGGLAPPQSVTRFTWTIADAGDAG